MWLNQKYMINSITIYCEGHVCFKLLHVMLQSHNKYNTLWRKICTTVMIVDNLERPLPILCFVRCSKPIVTHNLWVLIHSTITLTATFYNATISTRKNCATGIIADNLERASRGASNTLWPEVKWSSGNWAIGDNLWSNTSLLRGISDSYTGIALPYETFVWFGQYLIICEARLLCGITGLPFLWFWQTVIIYEHRFLKPPLP